VLLVKEMLPLLDALTPAVREPVGETDTVLLPLTVLEGVEAAVPVPDCVLLPVAVPLGD